MSRANLSKPARAQVRRVVRRLAPDLLQREIAALEQYIDKDAPHYRLQLMAFGAKAALEFAIDPTQNLAPMRLLDLTQFALKLKRRTPPQVPVLTRKRAKA